MPLYAERMEGRRLLLPNYPKRVNNPRLRSSDWALVHYYRVVVLHAVLTLEGLFWSRTCLLLTKFRTARRYATLGSIQTEVICLGRWFTNGRCLGSLSKVTRMCKILQMSRILTFLRAKKFEPNFYKVREYKLLGLDHQPGPDLQTASVMREFSASRHFSKQTSLKVLLSSYVIVKKHEIVVIF